VGSRIGIGSVPRLNDSIHRRFIHFVRIEVDYKFWLIPLGCQSDACWIWSSMEHGSAAFDGTGQRTTIEVEPVLNLPF
jgi:hypothetical protein